MALVKLLWSVSYPIKGSSPHLLLHPKCNPQLVERPLGSGSLPFSGQQKSTVRKFTCFNWTFGTLERLLRKSTITFCRYSLKLIFIWRIVICHVSNNRCVSRTPRRLSSSFHSLTNPPLMTSRLSLEEGPVTVVPLLLEQSTAYKVMLKCLKLM